MNTHDIEPLKYGGNRSDDYVTGWNDCWAAIEADRKRRGEPVAYLRAENLVRLAQPHVAGCAVSIQKEPADGFIPIFTSPQPAEPVKLECPKCGADRAKEPCAGNLMNCAFKGEAHAAEPVKVTSDADIRELSHEFSGMTYEDLDVVAFARALLARYGQHTEWQDFPK